MDILEAIRSRRSIRGYKSDAVPRTVLREILAAATRAPSAGNTQPWQFTVITGQPLDDIKRANAEMLAASTKPHPDVPIKAYRGIHGERQAALYLEVYRLLGIAPADRGRQAEWTQMNYLFYDAPAVIMISRDASLEQAELDIGAVTQTICLAALNYGLGTCINYMGVGYPAVIRRHGGIPDSQRIVIAIAIGYPDRDFPANRLESQREPVDSITRWRGFD